MQENLIKKLLFKVLVFLDLKQYGFVIKSEFDFTFIWDGGDSPDSIKFWFNEEQIELTLKL